MPSQGVSVPENHDQDVLGLGPPLSTLSAKRRETPPSPKDTASPSSGASFLAVNSSTLAVVLDPLRRALACGGDAGLPVGEKQEGWMQSGTGLKWE